VATRWQGVFLSAILLLPLRLNDAQIGSKTSFLHGNASNPDLSLFYIPKAALWDIRKGATGGFPDRHKKTGLCSAFSDKKQNKARGLE
jgi:hypothetical protein